MSRKRRSVSARDPEFQAGIEQQIQRLREMLVLMGPETGSSALGATIRYASPPARRDEPLMLPSPDAAANF
jgi:hypothetical protein